MRQTAFQPWLVLYQSLHCTRHGAECWTPVCSSAHMAGRGPCQQCALRLTEAGPRPGLHCREVAGPTPKRGITELLLGFFPVLRAVPSP